MKKIIISTIKWYKKAISPYKIRSCRFSPTCSEYAVEAFEKYGVLRGATLSAWRILRCNPFSKGGYDPVPGKE
jgi:putative membrane protein insertion efficiency factor